MNDKITTAPATIVWRRVGGTRYTTTVVDLAHGRSRGLDDVTTAQRILAISKLGNVELADQIMVVDIVRSAERVRAQLRRSAAVAAIMQLIDDGHTATAQTRASQCLQDNLIDPTDYIQLVRHSEGR